MTVSECTLGKQVYISKMTCFAYRVLAILDPTTMQKFLNCHVLEFSGITVNNLITLLNKVENYNIDNTVGCNNVIIIIILILNC